jgi:predicted small lipoprotein YifL
MSRSRARAWGLLVLPALAAGMLAGCGLKGDLEQPAPWYGEARREYEAEQAAKAKAEADRRAAKAERDAAKGTPAPPVTPPPAREPVTPPPQ